MKNILKVSGNQIVDGNTPVGLKGVRLWRNWNRSFWTGLSAEKILKRPRRWDAIVCGCRFITG